VILEVLAALGQNQKRKHDVLVRSPLDEIDEDATDVDAEAGSVLARVRELHEPEERKRIRS